MKEARATTDAVLKAKAVSAAGARAGLEDKSRADELIASANTAMERAIRAAGRDGSLRKRKLAVPEKLGDANDMLMSIVEEIAASRSRNVLDDDALDEALLGLRQTLVQIARQASRGVADPGEGLRWLQKAVQD